MYKRQVLSGNRNFDGRIHPYAKQAFLASPPLVVAYAIAGTVRFDIEKDVLGTDKDGKPVTLKDIWPSDAEIDAIAVSYTHLDVYKRQALLLEKVMNTQDRKNLPGTSLDYFDTRAAVDAISPGAYAKLPYTSRVHAENLVRRCDPATLTASLKQLIERKRDLDFPWFPARVVCHDILGQTALVDLCLLYTSQRQAHRD